MTDPFAYANIVRFADHSGIYAVAKRETQDCFAVYTRDDLGYAPPVNLFKRTIVSAERAWSLAYAYRAVGEALGVPFKDAFGEAPRFTPMRSMSGGKTPRLTNTYYFGEYGERDNLPHTFWRGREAALQAWGMYFSLCELATRLAEDACQPPYDERKRLEKKTDKRQMELADVVSTLPQSEACKVSGW